MEAPRVSYMDRELERLIASVSGVICVSDWIRHHVGDRLRSAELKIASRHIDERC